MTKSHRTQFLTAIASLLALLALGAVAAPLASAIGDAEELAHFGGVGEAAGQLTLERGIASDPTTGHVYTAESSPSGNRISEFTPWGEFVKAFGWDVAPGAVNEQQEVRVRAAAGQFRLHLGAESSGDLGFDAKASEVQAALGALGSVGAGNVSVEAVKGTADGATPFIYVVSFKGALAATDVAQLEAVDGTTPLSGGVSSSSLVVRTRVNGHAATAGFESCTSESGCKAGLRGEGAGQFSLPWGIAVDGGGDVYVREFANDRVQKFDSAGRFLLMFGGDVDQGPHHPGDVCSAADVAEGDSCGAGSQGSGAGAFIKYFDVAVGAGGDGLRSR